MGKHAVVTAWLLLASILCSQACRANDSRPEDLLADAEQISSIDSAELSRLLRQIQLHAAELSSFQQQQYRLLKIEQALQQGQTALANEALQEFSSIQQPMQLRYRVLLVAAKAAMAAQQYQTAFNQLQAVLQDYALIRQPRLQAAALLLAVDFYSQANLPAAAEQHLQLLASIANALVEQCQAAYLQATHADRQLLAHTAPVSQAALRNCTEAQLPTQLAALQWFNRRIMLAVDPTTASDLSQPVSPADVSVDSQLWQVAHALQLQRLADADQLSSDLLNLPEAAMTMPQRLDLLRLRSAVLTQQQRLAEVVFIQQKIYELNQIQQTQQTSLKLAAEAAVHHIRQQNAQLKLLQHELKAIGLESQLKKQLVQRNYAVIALLVFLALGLIYGLFRLGLAHQHYKTAAFTDPVTGIGNRRWLDAQLAKLLHRCKQQGRPAGMILFEIDQFSQLVAGQGHEKAQQALLSVSKMCHHFIRHGDLFCYLENGCFAIVLPDCQPDKVLLLAEICRDAIAEPSPVQQPTDLRLTASFGVSLTLNSGYSDAELWRHADQALYLAKHHGQNRVECFDDQRSGRPVLHRALSPDLVV